MSAAPNPGDVLAGRYSVERVLGEGGMGVVVAAQHLMLGERVAVKILLPEAARIPGVLERFQREARAAATIQSEHVARVMDVGVLDDARPYLVMEYLEGQDLAAALEARGPLPIAEAVDSVLEAAIGVASAHALGVVHRDLKPSNLFRARQPNGRTLVKVLDFGIAKQTGADEGNLTSTFSALGSAAYMSPEQVRAAKTVDARTDVWAFGIVLFELLTGQIPFDGESVTALAAAIIADAPKSLCALRPDAPPELETAILGCLEKDRDKRFASLAALAKAISPFGGTRASGLAARVSEALGSTGLSVPPPPSAPAQSGTRTEAVPSATRATWATSEGKPSARSALLWPLVAVGGAGVVVLLIAWFFAGSSDGAGAAASAAPAAPAVQRTEPPSEAARAVPPTPVLSATPAPPTRPVVAPVAPKAKPAAATRPAPAAKPARAKKPLVKDL